MNYYNFQKGLVESVPKSDSIPLLCLSYQYDPSGTSILWFPNKPEDIFILYATFKFSGFKKMPGFFWAHKNYIIDGMTFPCNGMKMVTKEELFKIVSEKGIWALTFHTETQRWMNDTLQS